MLRLGIPHDHHVRPGSDSRCNARRRVFKDHAPRYVDPKVLRCLEKRFRVRLSPFDIVGPHEYVDVRKSGTFETCPGSVGNC